MRAKNTKKLVLNRQTIRQLTTTDLGGVAGGITYRCVGTGTSHCNAACGTNVNCTVFMCTADCDP